MFRVSPLVRAAALAVLVTASAAQARPRGYAERTLTTKDGLSQATVTAFAQDPRGYLWIGTQEGGVDRFDGATFRAFGGEDGLPSQVVRCMTVDRTGRVWVGGAGTLAVLEGSRFRAVELPPALRQHAVLALFPDADALYVGGGGGDVVRVVGDRVETIALPPMGMVNRFARDADGALVIAHSKGILRVGAAPGAGATPVSGVEGAISLQLAPDHSLWFGNNGGLSVLADGVHTRIEPASQGESLDGVLDIVLDPDGVTRWVASSSGVWRVGPDRKAQRAVKTDGPVGRILVDREGDVWFDTFGAIHALTPSRIDAITKDDGLPNDNVMPVLVARDGTVWAGTAAGVAHIDGDRVTRYGAADGVAASLLLALVEDAKGRICAGGVPGLYCLDGARFTAMGRTAASGMWVPDAAAMPDGSVLFTGRGLWRMDDHGAAKIERDLLGTDTVSITADREGRAWIGYASTAGATVLSPDGTSRHLTSASLPGMPIVRVYGTMQDANGRMWLGTDHGLVSIDGDRVRVFDRHAGFPDDGVGRPIEDTSGALWAPTNHGLARFDGERVTAVFTEDDGLPSNELSGGAGRDRDGRLWFGTTGGLAIVDPNHLPRNTVPPIVVVESVRAGEHAYAPDTLPAEIRAADNTLRFDFTATAMRRPRAMRFEYQLDGFDARWVPMEMPVVQRRVTYTNLSPGAYTFRVRATNDDGVWSASPAVASFRVLAPWWRTWWALAAYACAFASVGASVTHVRTRGLRRRTMLLEMKVRERTEELSQKVALLARQNEEVVRINQELGASHRRAHRIFSALAEALPGTVLDDKYKLGERIGAGGFGAVFHATHLGLRKEVAVKVFRPAPGNDSAEALERFQREASNACRVKHPNAVNVFDSGISREGIAYLVMELLVGESLASRIEREGGRLSPERIAEVIRPMCAALQAAHDAGIVHRDMKPDNVFLHHDEGGAEVVKVVDFGIARLVATDQGTQPVELTSADQVLGTPAYLAPERLTRSPHDGRADVFSVGVMVYRMLSGALPFDWGTGTYLSSVLSGASVRLRLRAPGAPEALEALVHRAIASQPGLRPTAIELGRELVEIVAAMPADARGRPLTVHAVVASEVAEVTMETASVPQARGA